MSKEIYKVSNEQNIKINKKTLKITGSHQILSTSSII